MIKYFPGANDAVARVERMNLAQLLEQIDRLYGRTFLSYGDDVEAVREEAIRQTYEDFTDYSEASPLELSLSKYQRERA